MRKSRFFKALMAWTLVVIMITANAGSVLTSRAVESSGRTGWAEPEGSAQRACFRRI